MPSDAPHSVYAVLSGDIVKSTALSDAQLKDARAVILDGVMMLDEKLGHPLVARPDFYSGDAWQLALTDPKHALRFALFIRANLHAQLDVGTRVSIGIGPVDRIDTKRISLSSGKAFTLSGRKLSEMFGYTDFAITRGPARTGLSSLLSGWMEVGLQHCSDHARGWTRRQAEIVALGLLHPEQTHEQLAAELSPPVKKQTVTAALNSAHWASITETLTVFQSANWNDLIND